MLFVEGLYWVNTIERASFELQELTSQGIEFSLNEELYCESSAEGESKELTMPSPMMVRVPDLVLMQPQKVFITDIFVLQDHKRAHWKWKFWTSYQWFFPSRTPPHTYIHKMKWWCNFLKPGLSTSSDHDGLARYYLCPSKLPILAAGPKLWAGTWRPGWVALPNVRVICSID